MNVNYIDYDTQRFVAHLQCCMERLPKERFGLVRPSIWEKNNEIMDILYDNPRASSSWPGVYRTHQSVSRLGVRTIREAV